MLNKNSFKYLMAAVNTYKAFIGFIVKSYIIMSLVRF